jgi:hypothetical protein
LPGAQYAGRVSSDKDDALSWDGDDDPTLDAGAPATGLPKGYAAVGKGSEVINDPDIETTDAATDTAIDGEPAAPAPMSNAALITYGIVAGVYVLYMIGWIIGGLRLQDTAEFLVSPVAYQVSLWLAVVAPALWLVTVMWVTRTSRVWVRMAWLIAGVLIFIPWPFVMLGVTGQ